MKKIKQRCITVIIDAGIDDEIEAVAKRSKTFKSAVIENALRAYIEKPETK